VMGFWRVTTSLSFINWAQLSPADISLVKFSIVTTQLLTIVNTLIFQIPKFMFLIFFHYLSVFFFFTDCSSVNNHIYIVHYLSHLYRWISVK
jgi:hypothetical protein